MEDERVGEIIREELIKNGLLSVFAKNINGVDTEFPEFKERTEKRLEKLEDITGADMYDYADERKLVKKSYKCTIDGEEIDSRIESEKLIFRKWLSDK